MQDASYFLRQAERLQHLAGECADRVAAAQLNLIADEFLNEAALRATHSVAAHEPTPILHVLKTKKP